MSKPDDQNDLKEITPEELKEVTGGCNHMGTGTNGKMVDGVMRNPMKGAMARSMLGGFLRRDRDQVNEPEQQRVAGVQVQRNGNIV